MKWIHKFIFIALFFLAGLLLFVLFNKIFDESFSTSTPNVVSLPLASQILSWIADYKEKNINGDEIVHRLQSTINSLYPFLSGSSVNKHPFLAPLSCSSKILRSARICDEIVMHNLTWPYNGNNRYFTNDSPKCRSKVSSLLTILLHAPKNGCDALVFKIRKIYPKVPIVSSVPCSKKFQDVQILEEHSYNVWSELASLAFTPYLLIGENLEDFDTMTDLERGLRLLEYYGTTVLAVGGSTRNSSGHWSMGCTQITLKYYTLKIRTGYRVSTCEDCMICDALSGPFLTRTSSLPTLFPNSLSWFLENKEAIGGGVSLLCPDIVFHSEPSALYRVSEVKFLAQKFKFQAFEYNSNDLSSPVIFYDCQDVNLKCEPRKDAQYFLLPFCCTENYLYILRFLQNVSLTYGVSYELDSGSLLGAVKIANYLPWDIDGDIYIQTSDIEEFFGYGTHGKGRLLLESAGISVSGIWKDNYYDRGAGYFTLFYGGIVIEMMGRRDLNSKSDTKVRVGDLWIPSHENPGKYLRNRYGPGYLRHAQSWRFLPGTRNSFSDYEKSGFWNECSQKNYHACLDQYPGDGNLNYLSSLYPGNFH